jgi:hypothetical protein
LTGGAFAYVVFVSLHAVLATGCTVKKAVEPWRANS